MAKPTRSTLQRAVNIHLKRIGTDIDRFLLKGIESGQGFDALAEELSRITQFSIHPRTLRRWSEGLEESVAS